jgi:hypothetical protein
VPIAVEITRHLGDREVAPGTKIVQPTFETRRFSLRSMLPMGAPSLLGTLNSPGETGAPDEELRQPATLAFVTASSSEAPRPEDAAAGLPAGAFMAVIEIYSMAPQQALETIKAHGEECIARALALASTGEAKLEEIMAVRGVATELISTATRHEFRYATEWEPARLSATEAKKRPQVPAIFSLPIPTSMETRDIGTDAQITLAPLKEGFWSASANIETVRLVRQQETPRGSHMLQPVFETRKLAAGIEAPVGKPTLLGSFSAQPAEEGDARAGSTSLVERIAEPKQRDRSWLAFITVHGAAVAPLPKQAGVEDNLPVDADKSAAAIDTPPRNTAAPKPTPATSRKPELFTQYYELSDAAVAQFPDGIAKSMKDYLFRANMPLKPDARAENAHLMVERLQTFLTKADVDFSAGGSVLNGRLLTVRNTRANLERMEAILGIKPSKDLVEMDWPLPTDLVDTGLLEEIPRPSSLSDPIPEKVWSCKKQLERSGISFPPGSYAIYLRNSKLLLASNTRTALDQIKAFFTHPAVKPPAR